MKSFPMFIRTTGRRVVICGGGEQAAQKALKARSKANTDAVYGKYERGTCSSVGTDGNVKQATGPY